MVIIVIIVIIIIIATMTPQNDIMECKIGESCYPEKFCIRPAAPKNIRTDTGTRNTIKIRWRPVLYAERYTIYRSIFPNLTKDNYEEKYENEGKDNTSRIIEGLTSTQQYLLVTASNFCGKSTHSKVIKINIICHPDIPSNLEAFFWSPGIGRANWNEVVNAVTYKLYVNSIEVFEGSTNTTTFITNVPGNYTVQVSSVGECEESPLSPIIIYEV